MYTGNGHRHVAAAVDRLQALEDVTVDWQIISAGFGTLDAEEPIIPYDCTFSRSRHTKAEYRTRADRLGVPDKGQTIDELIQDIGRAKGIADTILAGDLAQYDVIFAMLGREYLLAAADVFTHVPDSTAAFVFASDSMANLTGTFTRLPANETERDAIDAMGINQKELQFQTLANHIESAADLQAVIGNPDQIHRLSITTEDA